MPEIKCSHERFGFHPSVYKDEDWWRKDIESVPVTYVLKCLDCGHVGKKSCNTKRWEGNTRC